MVLKKIWGEAVSYICGLKEDYSRLFQGQRAAMWVSTTGWQMPLKLSVVSSWWGFSKHGAGCRLAGSVWCLWNQCLCIALIRIARRGRQRRMPIPLFLHLKLVCAHYTSRWILFWDCYIYQAQSMESNISTESFVFFVICCVFFCVLFQSLVLYFVVVYRHCLCPPCPGWVSCGTTPTWPGVRTTCLASLSSWRQS